MSKDNFFKFYANLPINLREETILIMDNGIGPITWRVALREINSKTELGQKIYDKLMEHGFIPKE